MEPFANDGAYLQAELDRVDALLYRYLETWRAEQSTDGEVPGLYVSDTDVEAILAGEDHRSDGGVGGRAAAGTAREPLDREGSDLEARVRATHAAGRELRLRTLADRFDLDRRHLDAMVLAMAPELDLAYEKVYAYLQDDLTRKRPTVGLIARVLDIAQPSERAATGRRASPTGGALDPQTRLSESSPPVAADLLRLHPPDPRAPTLAATVSVDPRIVGYCLGDDTADPALADTLSITTPDTAIGALPLSAADRERLDRARLTASDAPTVCTVSGPSGVGFDAAVAALASDLDRPMLTIDLGALRDDEETAMRLRREARLRDGIVHVCEADGSDGADDGEGVDLVRAVARGLPFVVVSGADPPDCSSFDAYTREITLSRPGVDRRRELWTARSDRLAADVDLTALADTFALTRGQIDAAIETARREADGLPDQPTVEAACRTHSRETLGSLATRTDPTATLDEIVLPAEQQRDLDAVAAHVAERGTVYADWGFADRFSLGAGLNVLFSGPSGTGKTLAAEIVANEASLDLFRIDLASVVSKYIGETESHLKQIFDEAAHSDAVLFFDEADALFGERSEVSDSHDRYANVEVSYLLQRMEDHEGTTILTTNLEENIDDAFQRRINVTVEFPRPDAASRYAIWQTIFPAETPVGELDYEFLAEFDLTGGNIKNVALTAAFLAADDRATGDPGRVEMTHVVRALRRELKKTGRLVGPDAFGPYRDCLR